MIRIDHTSSNTELLLFIPPDLRHRAKKVGSCFWDPKRKAWVFPREREIYAALKKEFQYELSRVSNLNNQNSTEDTVSILRNEIRLLSESIGNSVLKKEYDLLETRTRSEISQLSKENTKLGELLKQRELQISDLQEQLLIANSRNILLDNESVFDFIKEIALQASDDDDVLKLTLGRLSLDDKYLPIEVGKIVEFSAKNLLDSNCNNLKFHEVLEKIRDQGLLSDIGLDLAHTIRKQRNLVAHSDIDEISSGCRSIYMLSALALYWTELNEAMKNSKELYSKADSS